MRSAYPGVRRHYHQAEMQALSDVYAVPPENLAQAATDQAPQYARERITFGTPIYEGTNEVQRLVIARAMRGT